MDNYHSKEFQIRSYEVGTNGELKISSILNFFQEIASEHAAKLGVSVLDLFRKNLTWVLSRYHIQIDRFPLWQESITINSWPSERGNPFAIREFEIIDNNNVVIGRATSSWLVYNFKKKNVINPVELLHKYPIKEERAIADDFGSLKKLEKTDIELPFRVRMSDLDMNRHVNNAIYVDWAIEALPKEILMKYQLSSLEVSFRGEAFYGDRILSRTQITGTEEDPSFLHQVLKEKDDSELTRLITKWQKNKK